MELREALTQIYEIRRHVARTEVFRGYRSITVAMTGIVALFVAGCQTVLIPKPHEDLFAWVCLWIAAALVSMALTASEILWRCRSSTSDLAIETTILALGQFLPSIIAGGLVTVVLFVFAAHCLWMLPGMWAVLFSLGIFASFRLLPTATFWVAAFYLVAGLICLALAQGEMAFSPWAMGLPFGGGQFLAAGILYWTLERKNVES